MGGRESGDHGEEHRQDQVGRIRAARPRHRQLGGEHRQRGRHEHELDDQADPTGRAWTTYAGELLGQRGPEHQPHGQHRDAERCHQHHEGGDGGLPREREREAGDQPPPYEVE
jgi:hypothetical protein